MGNNDINFNGKVPRNSMETTASNSIDLHGFPWNPQELESYRCNLIFPPAVEHTLQRNVDENSRRGLKTNTKGSACLQEKAWKLYTGKNNGFPFLDIFGYLRIPIKIPNLAKWDKSQPGNSQPSTQIGTCLTLPNLGFLRVFFEYPKISKNGNPLFFPVIANVSFLISSCFKVPKWLLVFWLHGW